ncbi:penicillin acylase family protein [Opitutaceae bacterium]
MNLLRVLCLAVSVLSVPSALCAASAPSDVTRWEQQAAGITIHRDGWGIAHVFGKTDADAVFGMVYAQAEDDFNRVELNYVNALGRAAEIEGEAALDRDLRMKLFIDPTALQALYVQSPAWLRALMDAFADGLNYYLHTHPAVKPKLITRFEPWMALAFTEGSIGGDIESIATGPLGEFYRTNPARVAAATPTMRETMPEPTGSNGFAIAPSRSASGHALLLINPHTSFYFRPEIHVVSEEGLNAYGAVTWGQFFIYQGFNDRAGWMHTSGGADVIDEYEETVVEINGKPHYRYGDELKPFLTRTIELPYRTGTTMARKSVTAYFSHRGPIIRRSGDDKWIAVRLMQSPIDALSQSYLRTKARSHADFRRTMELRTNSSNNTVYADADGTIAYFHGNFVPKRELAYDWQRPVDGKDPLTDWQGLHAIDELIALHNPASGWLQNTNNWPFSAAGDASPRREDYRPYMWQTPSPGYGAENPRGVNAVRVLKDAKDVTLESLIALAYDPTLSAFEYLLPPLVIAYDSLPARDPRKTRFAGPIAALRAWDHRTGVNSVPTTLAVLWAQELADTFAAEIRSRRAIVHEFLHTEIKAEDRLAALGRTLDRLERDFGSWQTPWGEINRFQRLSGEVRETHDDNAPSLPIGLAPSAWGSLAAFGTATGTGTKRIYGNRGNSFVAVVEFGPRVRAKSVLAGGVSGDPKSPHFNDQAAMYARGEFKDVLFYREDIEKAAQRTYQPGK